MLQHGLTDQCFLCEKLCLIYPKTKITTSRVDRNKKQKDQFIDVSTKCPFHVAVEHHYKILNFFAIPTSNNLLKDSYLLTADSI